MFNTKEEVKSIDDLIGKLYAKITQRNKQIKRLKNERASTKDELKSVKEEYDDARDRLELIMDSHPMVLDTLRDHGFDAGSDDVEDDLESQTHDNADIKNVPVRMK